MAPRTTTFPLAVGDLSLVIRTLTARRLTAEVTDDVAITLLDTFDGRLHRAGLHLTLHESDDKMLVLTGDDDPVAPLPVAVRPGFAADLPAGPLHTRLAPVVDVRALLPRLRIGARRTRFTRRSNDGAIVVTADVHTFVGIIGTPDTAVPTTTVEITDVAGRRRPAHRVVDAIVELGHTAFDGDTLALAAARAGLDTTGTAPRPPPLDPAMPAIDGFALVLGDLATTIDANWHGTTHHLDPEFLHDLRVAVRRTRTVLTAGKNVLPAHVLVPARDRFRRLGALTGPARDLDVFLLEWDHYTRPLGAATAAALDPMRDLIERRQRAAHAELGTTLCDPDTIEWQDTWRHLTTELPQLTPPGKHADRTLGRVVAARIDQAQHRLLENGRTISPAAHASQVHDLRKDAKKLRYLLQCFGDVGPDQPRSHFVKRLKNLQDNLGLHQDAEVHSALVRELAAELHQHSAAADTLLAAGRLVERLENIRVDTRHEFSERWAAYDRPKTQAILDAFVTDIPC